MKRQKTETTELIKLFESHFAEKVKSVEPIKAHGSERKLYRLVNAKRSVIGVENHDKAENIAFLTLSRHFRENELPVPLIFAQDLENGIYLEEDLGTTTLYDKLVQERHGSVKFPNSVLKLYEKVVQILPKFQIEASKDLDFSTCYPRHSFDRQSMLWDLNYFKYYFIKLVKIPFHEQKLENDFEQFVQFLLQADQQYFLYRDFQSRNIMVRCNNLFFIDYQGGRRGALQYDIASLLFDAKADIPADIREKLLQDYLNAANQYQPIRRNEFIPFFYGYALVRILQALGAYGYRGFYEQKSHFLKSVPYAIRNLEFILTEAELPVQLPSLFEVLRGIVRSSKLREITKNEMQLTVHIQSFSYKNGLPQDKSGHGGGFIFDCRALPNPGRHEKFAHQTGNDAAVISFLTQETSVHQFLTHVCDLINPAIENYLSRNFTYLSIAFGCTGGQHRSVFCANSLARYLRNKYPVNVEVSHRELESKK